MCSRVYKRLNPRSVSISYRGIFVLYRGIFYMPICVDLFSRQRST